MTISKKALIDLYENLKEYYSSKTINTLTIYEKG